MEGVGKNSDGLMNDADTFEMSAIACHSNQTMNQPGVAIRASACRVCAPIRRATLASNIENESDVINLKC